MIKKFQVNKSHDQQRISIHYFKSSLKKNLCWVKDDVFKTTRANNKYFKVYYSIYTKLYTAIHMARRTQI